jgi:hypothetical protein
MILACVILCFLAFTLNFFNTSQDIITLEDITAFKASMKRLNAENVKEYVVSVVKKADLSAVIEVAKQYIFLRPQQKEMNTPIPWKTIFPKAKEELQIIRKIIFHKPYHMSLFWAIILVFVFGFWDTFAASFLIPFLDFVKHGWSYILLGLIVIPGIVLQPYAGTIASRIGIVYVGIF